MAAARRALLFFALAISLALCVAGCRQRASSRAAAGGDTLANIRREGVLRWGADATGGAPFVFYDPQDPKRVIGFEIDLMEKFAAHMGVKQQMVQGDWAALIDNMLARRTDMVVNGVEINEERAKRVAFSTPYYEYEQQLTVRVEDKDKVRTLVDLKGLKVGTLNAAEANNVLKRAGWTDDLICVYDDSLTPYNELKLERVRAVLQESIIAAYYAGKDPKLYNIPRTFSPGEYAVALRQEDASLLRETDRVLDLMKRNGELAAIYIRWDMWNERQAALGIQQASAPNLVPGADHGPAKVPAKAD
jgi:polar amino acid transport system substrate-binding protein